MKCLINRLAIAALLLTASAALAAEDKVKAPKSPLKSLSGDTKFVGDASKSDVTVIQFWASWCTGCSVVMAQMTDLLANQPHIGYVTVSLDEKADTAMKYFANKPGMTKDTISKSYLDASGQTFSELNGVDSLPYLLIVSKDGTVLKRVKGHPTKADLALLTRKGS
jgi:thiol-disulfide isomerase/thioredoxin